MVEGGRRRDRFDACAVNVLQELGGASNPVGRTAEHNRTAPVPDVRHHPRRRRQVTQRIVDLGTREARDTQHRGAEQSTTASHLLGRHTGEPCDGEHVDIRHLADGRHAEHTLRVTGRRHRTRRIEAEREQRPESGDLAQRNAGNRERRHEQRIV